MLRGGNQAGMLVCGWGTRRLICALTEAVVSRCRQTGMGGAEAELASNSAWEKGPAIGRQNTPVPGGPRPVPTAQSLASAGCDALRSARQRESIPVRSGSALVPLPSLRFPPRSVKFAPLTHRVAFPSCRWKSDSTFWPVSHALVALRRHPIEDGWPSRAHLPSPHFAPFATDSLRNCPDNLEAFPFLSRKCGWPTCR